MTQPFRVVVIGGVAAGPKIASKVRRLRPDAEVTVIEKSEVISYAGCGLPYYIAGVVREQKELLATPAGAVRDPAFFLNVKNVMVHNRTEALEIDRKNKRVRVRSLADGQERWIEYDKLALATGARANRPRIPGADLPNVFTLKTVADAEALKQLVEQKKAADIVIVGGGLIGLELAEAFVGKGVGVTMIEMLDQILAPLDREMALLVEKYVAQKGVRVLTGTTASAIERGENDRLQVILAGAPIPCDAVVFAVGIRPNVELAQAAGLEIGPTGAIRVDDHLRTSDPDLYAAGDCVEVVNLVTGKPAYVPLGSTSNKQGRVVAVNLCGGDERFPGVVGSTVCKVFDYTVGWTGLSEGEARKLGYDAVSCLVPGPDKAHYFPGKKMLMLKLVADRATGRLLGLQAIGPGDAAKRLDVAATAITAGMTVDQVSQLDLTYAPPYSGALDNLITAANVTKNKIAGHMDGLSPLELARRLDAGEYEDMVLLDVRTPGEFESGHLRHAVHIPLGALRQRAGELPRNKEIIVYCGSSLRAYEGALILRAAGCEHVKVLDGSIAMWPYGLVK